MSTLTSEQILAIPLPELRERVELAERLALASRLTPPGAYAGSPSPVNPSASPAAAAPAATAGKRKTKAEKEAEDRAAAAAAAAAAQAKTAEDDALFADLDGGSEGGADLTLGDGFDGDDMLAGFTEAQPAVTVEEAKANITNLVNDIQTKRDVARLTKMREVLKKYGVERVGEVSDDKIVAFWGEVKSV